MRLGQRVEINSFFQKNNKNTDSLEEIPWDAKEIELDKLFEFQNYSPEPCEPIKGIITGYKQLSTRIQYYIERKDTVQCSWIREPVYVVQTTLVKKYFVKRDWVKVI